MNLTVNSEMNEIFGCQSKDRSGVTILNGVASINAFCTIEAMPLWIATHSFGMLAMTDQTFI